jgi:aromatic-L-amino-acid/L-tryptophan decarboxylase
LFQEPDAVAIAHGDPRPPQRLKARGAAQDLGVPLELPPEDFHLLADRVSRAASDYLAGLDRRPSFPATSGTATAEVFEGPLPEQGVGSAAFDALGVLADHSRPGNARFFGYVLGSGEPVAALGDLYASVLNQNVTAWRSAPAAVTIERTAVRWLAEAVGCPGFTGSLVGGGSWGNLMGLAMAREASAPANEHGARPCAAYASAEVHMSVPKALAVLGTGRSNLRLIPVDDAFRMRTDALAAAIEQDRRAGLPGIAIIATAGTTSTGAVDPLREIAGIARASGLWLHVDGAYGGLAALAAPELFTGLAEADSISLDAHKWLYQPLDCGVVLYRDAGAARRAFAYTGEYARSLSDDPVEGFAFFEESLELSRRFRALKLWLSLRYHGVGQFRAAIGKDLRHARLLAQLITAEPSLQLLAPVGLSAVCFRWKDTPAEDLDRRNAAIMREVMARGRVCLSNARVRGAFALRACIVNHRTTDADVAAVVEEVLAAAMATG